MKDSLLLGTTFAVAAGLLALPSIAIAPGACVTSPLSWRTGSVSTATMTGPGSIILMLRSWIVGELPWWEDGLSENGRFSRCCVQ